MNTKETLSTDILDVEQLEKELQREQHRVSKKSLLIGVLCALPVIAAIVIIFVSLMPVYQIHGSSMEPVLSPGDLLLCTKGDDYQVGDVVALEYDGRILIKRIVAGGDDWVSIDENGVLYINGEAQDEPYIKPIKDGTQIGVEPLQVPHGEWYILGDNRLISGDSRIPEVGTVSDEQIIGRVVFRIWPLNKMGTIE